MCKITIKVEGPRGSGKSTILSFIKYQLFQHHWVKSLKFSGDHELEVELVHQPTRFGLEEDK